MSEAGSGRLPVPLLARATSVCAVAAAVVAGTAWLATSGLDLGARYPVKAAAAFLLMTGVALTGLRRHHPFARFGPANRITTLRAALVSLVAGAVGEAHHPRLALAAVLTALAATVLDGADGSAARRSGMASAFGARFDMEVDAVLILVLAVLVWQFEKSGPWVVASGLMRYAFVLAGWGLPWMRRALPQARRRQAVCVIQLAGLMVALTPWVSARLSAAVAAVSLLALTWSFGVDVRWLWRAR